MTTSELDNRSISISMRKSAENLVISSQDAIGQSISQALSFSGVVTQHNSIQEIRNVSRSPSPSLRGVESGVELIENEKAISANSSSRNSEGAGSGGRAKKKSWYNSLYPTYKSKSEDFKRLFKDVPDDERLIVDYSCAILRDILLHGRLYASQNYLCFYANIFGWETTVSLRWKDVTAITKEKTALVIPNAILVCTEGEKNFLTSFSSRDKSFMLLFRIWQNALMDQPMSSQEFWQWVRSSYGEELGFNSEDEDCGRDSLNEAPVAALPDNSEDILDTSSVEMGGEGREEGRQGRSVPRDDSTPPLVRNGEGGVRDERGEAGDRGEGDAALPTDMSETSDSEPDKHHNASGAHKCTSPHDGKLILRTDIPFNIDQLFTMIFTNSKFSLEMLAARGTRDYVQAAWQPAGGLKCRQVSYRMGLVGMPIGPKEVQVTERQVMNACSEPGELYSIDCSSENAGIPYADHFTVEVHYCLQRRAHASTLLQIYCQVKYRKSMWPMVKGLLEKGAYSGIEDYSRVLESRLLAEAEAQAPAKRKGRRARNAHSCAGERRVVRAGSASVGVRGVDGGTEALGAVARGSLGAPTRGSGSGWLVGIVLLLLVLNALLYWRLCQQPAPQLEQLHARLTALAGDAGGEWARWARLLEQHSVRQRGQLMAWRDALSKATAHLAHTEQTLTKLLEAIKPSLERAQREAHGDEL